ncbi:MAG: phosphonate metabolism transcriptional regulator PhnF, partial [Cyanobacteria bacterium J06553_1]
MSEEYSPLYIQIAEQLRQSVQSGIYKVDERLPAEAQLAEQFGVNRHTLRQAIALLKQEGILRIERGRGTFVTAAPIRYAIGKRVRYNESLKAQGLTVRFELVRSRALPASESVAKGLSVEVGSPVALVERLGYANDIPISVGSGYFPLALFPDLLSAESIEDLKTTGSISRWLRDRYNIDHIRQSTVVSARLVQPSDAKLLALPLNQPILLAESVNVDQSGRVIEYGVAKLRGDRMELFFENNSVDS